MQEIACNKIYEILYINRRNKYLFIYILKKENIMKIEIVTTPNNNLKESGFGSEIACKSMLKSLKNLKHTSRINICKEESDLEKNSNKKA